MVLHGCGLCRDLLILCLALDLLVEVLRKFRIYAEVAALQKECLAPQRTRRKVYQALGIERLTLVSRLEVQVRPYHLTRRHPIVRFDQTLRQMAVIGLQTVVMAYDDKVAITPVLILRYAHASVKGGIYRITHLKVYIGTLMASAASNAIFGVDLADNGIMVTLQ